MRLAIIKYSISNILIMKSLKTAILAVAGVLLLFTSCNNDETTNAARVQVYLVDAPADYDGVYVEVEDVQINLEGRGEDDGWYSLEGFEPKIYNLLELNNGKAAFLGELDFPAGRLNQVRLILGDDNELEIGTDLIELKVPSGSQSGLKINVDEEVSSGFLYELIIDFDAGKSVVKAGNSGKYLLKPVLRAKIAALSGAIAGSIQPTGTDAIIYAIIDQDTASTYPNEAGQFVIRPLYPGLYEVVALPAEDTGLDTLKIEDVEVSAGLVSEVGDLVWE